MSCKDKTIKAIVIVKNSGEETSFKKYNYINNSENSLKRFERFCKRTFPGADHINYYEKMGKFIRQQKLKDIL